MADYRDLAIEQTTDDLFAVAAQSAAFRDMSKLAIETIVERDRKIESLQRQLQAVKDEYQAHRERTMRASLADSASEPVPVQPRTYTPRSPSMPPHRTQRRRIWRPPQGVS
jgi:hypothetical protein